MLTILLTILTGFALAAGVAESQPARDLTEVETFELTCEFRMGFSKARDLNRVLTQMTQAAQNHADELGCGPVELVRFDCAHLYGEFYQCEFSFGRWERREQDENNQ